MKPEKERRSLLSRMAFTLLGGCLYVSLLIQPACPGEDDSNPVYIDAAPMADAAPAQDAPSGGETSTPSEAGTEASTSALDPCWLQAVASYVHPDPGCGIASTALTTTATQIQLMPYGANATALFTPKPGAALEATATGLIIFGQGNHTCTVTCTPGETAAATKISTACTNTGGGSCSQQLNRQ